MSILDHSYAVANPTPELWQTQEDNPKAVFEKIEVRAEEVVKLAIESLLRAEQAVKKTGRNHPTAMKCRSMINDFFLGLDELRRTIRRMQSGDAKAAREIPGLLADLKGVMNFEALMQGNKGYYKDGQKVMAGYIYETITALSNAYQSASEAVLPMTEVESALAIQQVSLGVRQQLNAVAGYKFNTKDGIKTLGIEKPAQAVAEAAFTPAEEAWFKEEPTPELVPEPAAVEARREGFFSKLKTVLGQLMPSRRTLALAGAALVLGCQSEPEKDTPPLVLPTPAVEFTPEPAATIEAPALPPLAGSVHEIDENAPTLWHAIRGAIKRGCGLKGKALEQETGRLIREDAFVNLNTQFQGFVGEMQESANSQARLAAVTADLSKYGVTVGNSYEAVLADVEQTGEVGAYNMTNEQILNHAEVTLTGYSCPAQ